MANTDNALMIFSNKNLDKHPTFSAPWDGLMKFPMTGSDCAKYGHFCPKNGRQNVHPDLAKALLIILGYENNDHCVVKVGNDHFYAELKQADNSYRIIKIAFESGETRGTAAEPTAADPNNYRFTTLEQVDISAPYDFTTYMLCCLGEIFYKADLKTTGFETVSKAQCLDVLKQYQTDQSNAEDVKTLLLTLSATIRYGLNKESNFNSKIPSDGYISLLTRDEINATAGGLISGASAFLSTKIAADKQYTFGELKNNPLFVKFRNRHNWSPEEEALIQKIPDDYNVLGEVVKLSTRYIRALDTKMQMSQPRWVAETGYGKTTGIRCLSALLGMPLVTMTCYPNMETNDFLASFVPDTSKQSDVPKLDFDSICNDPEGTYEILTGQVVDGISPSEVWAAYEDALRGSQGSATGFKLVESNLVKGLKNGWLVEIQESSRIKDEGVLVGLNAMADKGGRIPLVDGSSVTRHHNAFIVFTDNKGYSSCRNLDPSVIRRNSYVIDSPEMTKEQLLSRVIYNTGYDNQAILDKIYTIWKEIRRYCDENEISEGPVSATELENWVFLVSLDGGTKEILKTTCLEAVVNKASSDSEEQNAIFNAIESLF